jgi:hypothetical protein
MRLTRFAIPDGRAAFRAPGGKRAALRSHPSLWAASYDSARRYAEQALRLTRLGSPTGGAAFRAPGAKRAALRSHPSLWAASYDSALRRREACGAALAPKFVGGVI